MFEQAARQHRDIRSNKAHIRLQYGALMTKQDFLRECMSEFRGAPIDAFNREFCTVCSNRECSRSWGNASGFDARVRNWRSVLFENVPRMENSQAANPNFTPADQGRVPEIVTQTFETSPAPLSFDDVPDTEPGTPADDQGAPVHRQAAVQTPPAPNPAPAVPQVNTPFQQPAMLSGSPPQEQAQAPGSVFVFDDD